MDHHVQNKWEQKQVMLMRCFKPPLILYPNSYQLSSDASKSCSTGPLQCLVCWHSYWILRTYGSQAWGQLLLWYTSGKQVVSCSWSRSAFQLTCKLGVHLSAAIETWDSRLICSTYYLFWAQIHRAVAQTFSRRTLKCESAIAMNVINFFC